MAKPRVLTPEEVRTKLLEHVWTMIDYWDKEARTPESRDKLSGLAFSILVALDGSSMVLPAFKVVPMPHPSDKAFCKKNGENWYPTDEPDIGPLHDFFHQHGK